MLHKLSRSLVQDNATIFVGNVSSGKLVKTKMAKTKMANSTLDAGRLMLKTMLDYKIIQAGNGFDVHNERYTNQNCSCCESIVASSPRGKAGLRIRE